MQTSAVTFLNDNRSALVQLGPHFINTGQKAQEAAPPAKRQARDIESIESIEKIKSVLQEHNISLQFSTDPTTNGVVVKMVDEKTGEAIRQFPTAVSLKLAANFQKLQGHFINME